VARFPLQDIFLDKGENLEEGERERRGERDCRWRNAINEVSWEKQIKQTSKN